MAADGGEVVTLKQVASVLGYDAPESAPDVGDCVCSLKQFSILTGYKKSSANVNQVDDSGVDDNPM